MKMNFVSKPELYSKEMFKQLDSLSNELSDIQLVEMLNEPWRLSKVGAWMIGIGNRQTLKEDLIKYLDKTPADYPEHALVNLLILTKDNSTNYIKIFLERQIKYYVSSKEYIVIEHLSIHWAIAILKYIDEEFEQSNLKQTESKQFWIEFMEHVNQRSDKDIIELIESNYYTETIKGAIRQINN
jgi:hypothetical protein